MYVNNIDCNFQSISTPTQQRQKIWHGIIRTLAEIPFPNLPGLVISLLFTPNICAAATS